MSRVSGKIALITGAAAGLGKADALRLAEEGATVILTDINDDGQVLAVKISESTGQQTRFFHHDVSDESRWEEIMAAVVDEFGGLDVLVNNAGIAFIATPEDTTLEQFRLANSVMSEGVFLGCRTAIPAMKLRGGGSIINMSSVASHLGYPIYFPYTAAKGAVRSMTKCIAVHCQMNGYNIRCNSIHGLQHSLQFHPRRCHRHSHGTKYICRTGNGSTGPGQTGPRQPGRHWAGPGRCKPGALPGQRRIALHEWRRTDAG